MGREVNNPFPKPGTEVVTACKGHVFYEEDTPSVEFRGKRVFFCLPACLIAFQDDPKTSCMAGDLQQESG